MRPFAGIDRGADRGRPRLPRPELLDAATSSLKGVGSKTETALRQLGIDTLRDLLLYRPRRYEPPAPRSTISALIAGQPATIVCAVTSVSVRRTRRRSLTIVEALVTDDSGSIVATWFNQAWLLDRLTPGLAVELRGSVERTDFVVRSYDLEGTGELDRITPVYPASEALPSKRLRELVSQVIGYAGDVPDPLPAELRARLGLPAKADAILAIHEPTTANEAETARRRLAFEELLVMQVGLAVRRSAEQVGGARSLGEPGELIRRYLELLPFSLTAGQERVLREIDADLGRSEPMERLLQGDVGSGKTVVALYVLLRAVEAGHQGALMAPTETLAEQHFMTIEQLCADLGVPCLLLTGSRGKPALREARGLLTTGEAGIAVGTHALIQEGVEFRSLAASVVDEQHRFGVEQRRALVGLEAAAGSVPPHRLHMTATPIPRTLALTVWGDMSISELDESPRGRKPIITRWITHDRSSEAYRRLTRLLREGRQAYVVCPLVSPSEAIEARAAEEEAERLRSDELSDFEVACVHGKLRAQDRRKIMRAFARGEIQALVATTVIEVGIDVPNATIMIIQEADRFGLAQLHQLRGRVGRGAEQSYCLLVSRRKEELTEAAVERLQALVETTDGFELAEADLELRGGGHLLGVRQTGGSDLRFTRLRSDRAVLERARATAGRLGVPDPLLADEIVRMFGDENHRGNP